MVSWLHTGIVVERSCLVRRADHLQFTVSSCQCAKQLGVYTRASAYKGQQSSIQIVSVHTTMFLSGYADLKKSTVQEGADVDDPAAQPNSLWPRAEDTPAQIPSRARLVLKEQMKGRKRYGSVLE